MRIVYDIEGNGLRPDTIWCAVTKDIDTGVVTQYTDHDNNYKPLSEFIKTLEAATVIIGHNIIRWDNVQLKRIYGWEPNDDQRIIDTLIMSRLNNFTRPETRGKHGLDPWGESVGIKKPPINDWMTRNPEFIHRCTEDVEINHKVYSTVVAEAQELISKKPLYRNALRVEHEMAKLTAEQIESGWTFDFEGCQKLIDTIGSDMEVMEAEIEPHLKDITRTIDAEPKTPLYKKTGEYTLASARMISEFLGEPVTPEDALKSTPPMEPGTEFVRTKLEKAGLGNMETVKDYLYELGWKPLEYNWKKIDGQFVKMSPKLCDKSLENIGHPHATMISEYYTLRSRRAVMKSWMEQADGDGCLRGDVNDQGAQSFRQTHKIIANLPSGKAKYGPEIRSLFGVAEGKILLSGDGAAYQLRLLAHYLKSDEYKDVILNGDAHQRHAEAMGITRDQAKPAAFAILYGCGGAKLGNIIGVDAAEGKRVRDNFINNVPNLACLLYTSPSPRDS